MQPTHPSPLLSPSPLLLSLDLWSERHYTQTVPSWRSSLWSWDNLEPGLVALRIRQDIKMVYSHLLQSLFPTLSWVPKSWSQRIWPFVFHYRGSHYALIWQHLCVISVITVEQKLKGTSPFRSLSCLSCIWKHIKRLFSQVVDRSDEAILTLIWQWIVLYS